MELLSPPVALQVVQAVARELRSQPVVLQVVQPYIKATNQGLKVTCIA